MSGWDQHLLALIPELVGQLVPLVAIHDFQSGERHRKAGEVIDQVRITAIWTGSSSWRLYCNVDVIVGPGNLICGSLTVTTLSLVDTVGPVRADVRARLRQMATDRLKAALLATPLPRNLVTYLGQAM